MAVSVDGQPSAHLAWRPHANVPEPRLPNAFIGIVAFTSTLIVAVTEADATKEWHWGAQLAVMTVTVGIICWWCRPLPSLLVSVCGWLMLNGFVTNSDAQLGWAGNRDVVRVLVLVMTGLCVSLARSLVLKLSSHSLVQRQGELGA